MARTYEETIYDATVDAVNDALAQPVLPTPDEIKGNILDNSRNAVTMYGAGNIPDCVYNAACALHCVD